jgi:hypothetical protein
MPKRLSRLAATLDRLRDVLAGRIALLQRERAAELHRRAALEALLQSDTRFLDLTLGGGLKRLREMSAKVSAIDQDIEKLRQRSADVYLKAKRARATAKQRRADSQAQQARLDLAELSDHSAGARLRQAKDR